MVSRESMGMGCNGRFTASLTVQSALILGNARALPRALSIDIRRLVVVLPAVAVARTVHCTIAIFWSESIGRRTGVRTCCIWHPINARSSLFQCSEQLYFQLAWKYIWFLSASPAVVSMFCVIFFPMLSYNHAHKNINSIVRKFLKKASSGYPYIFLSIWQITSLNGQSYRC